MYIWLSFGHIIFVIDLSYKNENKIENCIQFTFELFNNTQYFDKSDGHI